MPPLINTQLVGNVPNFLTVTAMVVVALMCVFVLWTHVAAEAAPATTDQKG